MKCLKIKFHLFVLSVCFLVFSPLAEAQLSAGGFSQNDYKKLKPAEQKLIVDRTDKLVTVIKQYMNDNKIMVAIMARRGAIKKKRKLKSDIDNIDATGFAHMGFIVKSRPGEYVTFNLVRLPGEYEDGKDASQLRMWSLEQFFMGRFEQDAGLLVPSKRMQLKLFNALMDYGRFTPRKVEFSEEGETFHRFVIEQGVFHRLHNPRYSLTSDYATDDSQNCTEHLMKVYLAVKNNTEDSQQLTQFIEQNITPHKFDMGYWKGTAAAVFTSANLRKGERRKVQDTWGKRWRYLIVTAEAFFHDLNAEAFDFEQIQIWREHKNDDGSYQIVDYGSDWHKDNSKSGKSNKSGIEELEIEF